MRSLLRLAGAQGKEVCFIFNDGQAKDESFFEDINNLLNAAEVPNLFPADELAMLIEDMRKPAKEEGRNLERAHAEPRVRPELALEMMKCMRKCNELLTAAPTGGSGC